MLVLQRRAQWLLTLRGQNPVKLPPSCHLTVFSDRCVNQERGRCSRSSTQRTGTGEGEADLFAGSRSSLEGRLGCVWRGGGSGRPGVLLSVTMALSCFSFSSFTQSLFCISSCIALTRLSCMARGKTCKRNTTDCINDHWES